MPGPPSGFSGVLVKHPRRRLTPLCPQLADVVDSEVLQVYMKPPAHEEARAPSKGFVVRDAPWTASGSEKVRCLRQAPPPPPPRPGRGRQSTAAC